MAEAWHYIAGAREVRDENGLLVASDVKPEDAAEIIHAPRLLAALKGLMQVATWDDEYTDQDEFNEAYAPCKALVEAIEAWTPEADELPEEAGLMIVCAHCDESQDPDDPDTEATPQQWRCGACGAWNDRQPKEA